MQILDLEETQGIALPTYTRIKASEAVVSTQRLVVFTGTRFLQPSKPSIAPAPSKDVATEKLQGSSEVSRRKPIDIDGADPAAVDLFARFIESQPRETMSLNQIHGMLDLIGRLRATQLLLPFAQYACAAVKHMSHWQVRPPPHA